MTLKSEPYWWVECDRCGVSAQEGAECTAWGQQDGALAYAEDSDWWTDDDGHALCWDCTPPDREDAEEADAELTA